MTSPLPIFAHLTELARERPEQVAVITTGGAMTYRQLEEDSDRCARGLKRIGIGRGTRTVLMVTPGIEFLVVTFALIKLGAVLVVVDPGMGWKNLGQCLAEAAPEAFVGIPRAQWGSRLLGWARETIRIRVTVGGPGWAGGHSYFEVLRLGEGESSSFDWPPPDEPAAIVFTSGSTGVPKGVVYTHRMFSAQAELLREEFGIQPGEVDLATFPLFALYDPALKMTTVFPRMDFSRPGRVDPVHIIDSIRAHQVTHMFGSPALLDRVGRYGEAQGVRLPSLKRVLSAGAPVSSKILVRFASLLSPAAEIYTPYGATEALPVCSISAREVLQESGTAEGKGVCVGRPLKGVGLAVIAISDDPIPQWSDEWTLPRGEVGELVVWGPNVSQEYYRRPEANALAKIREDSGKIRHRMGDLGWMDEQGRIWFCGRKSHRVVTPQGVLFSVACEGIFNQHPLVRRTALVGVGEAPRQRPVLCVELEDKKHWKGSERLKEEILALGARHPETRPIQTLLFHRAFPVDVRHNAKIFREELARWAARRLA